MDWAITIMIFPALRAAAGAVPLIFQNRKSPKNKRPLFKRISFVGN